MTAAAPPTSRPTRSTATPQPSPTPTTRGGRSNRQVDGLSGIELTSASALDDYCRRLEDLSNALAFELEMSNRELETALANMPGMRLFGAQGRIKARIVSRHLKAAADTAAHMRTLATRTKMSYRKHFGDEPRRRGGKVFDPHR